MRKKILGYIGLLTMLLQLAAPFFDLFPISKALAAPSSGKVMIDFGAGSNENSKYYSNEEYIASKTVDLNIPEGNHLVSRKVVINGTNLGEAGTVSGNKLQLSSVYGSAKWFVGKDRTDPGHRISRNIAGNRWRHQGEHTKNIEFIPDRSTEEGKGFSQYPGMIPTNGIDVDSGRSVPEDPDLRYSNGEAVTAAYEAAPPAKFYPPGTDLDGNLAGIMYIGVDKVKEVKIVNATISVVSDAVPFAWGKSPQDPKKGMVKIHRPLNNTDNMEELSFGGQGHATTFNYYMPANTYWEAISYEYAGYIEYTYEPNTTPDLIPVFLNPLNACLEVGKPQTFRFKIKNNGAATNKSFKVSVYIDGSEFKSFSFYGLGQSEEAEGSFEYTFSSAVPKGFNLFVDSGNDVDEGRAEDNNKLAVTFTPKDSCSGDPGPGPGPDPGGPEVIKGDFIIDQMQIYYKQNNKFIPKDVSVSGGNSCTFKSVKWTVKQGGGGYEWFGTTPWSQEFTAPYPGGIGLGTVEVTLTITTTCGTTKIIGPKTFTIVDDPANPNRPPVFEGGWFSRYNTTYYPPITTAIEGDMVHLGIVHDPTQTPNTPYDPDGDGIIYTWDFAGSTSEWIRGLPKTDPINFGKHNENFRWIKADVVGTHTIEVSAVDTRGKSGGTKRVTLNVIPKDPAPVPIITLPPRVIEGRPFKPDISCEKSYTIHPDRKIAGCYWTGKQTIYPTAGDYPITLTVTDNTGKESVAPATATLPVLPDLPPVAQLSNPGYGVRNVAMNFRDTSFSPDGDTIDVRQLTLTYDSNNNGSYDDETVTPITPDASGYFSITPTKVGKYKIHVYVREAEGYKKSDAKDFFFEVLNEGPDASFYVEGSDFTPPEYVSKNFTAADMLKGGNWRASSVAEPDKAKEYALNAGQNAMEAYDIFQKGTYNPVSPQQYRSPNPNQLSANKFKTWSCESWTKGCDASVTMMTDKLAYSWVWRMSFMNLNNTMPTGYKPSAVEPYSGYTWVPKVNVEDDLVWFRAKSEDTLSGYWRYHYKDYVFHVSDLEAASLSGSGLAPTALYHNEFTSAKENNWQEPPTPPMWIEPPAKADPKQYQTTYVFTENGSSFTEKTAKTLYSGDKQGNIFSYYCVRDASQWSSTVYNCALDKKTPSGNLIWRIDDAFSSVPEWKVDGGGWDFRLADKIVYMTNDGSKLVLETLNGLKIVDVASGGVIDQINATDYKLFGNKIVFFTSSRGPDGTYYNRTEGEYRWSITYDMRFSVYDVATGVRTVANEVVGNHNTESQTATVGTPPQITLSVDGKALFVTRYNKQTKLYIYDLNGATKIGEIRPPSEYLSPDTPDTFYMAPILYQDGKVFVKLDSSTDTTAIRLWQIEGTFDSVTANVPNNGQLFNTSDKLASGELVSNIRFNYNYFTPHITAGLSARIQDHKNMYRLEVSPSKTRLIKLVNGRKTVLQEVDFAIQFRKDYSVKLKLNGNRIRGYVGGTPLIDVSDGEFTSGYYGPYSETPFVLIKNLAVTTFKENDKKLKNVAIVGTPLNYVKNYSDAENDPAIDELAKWTYNHVEPNKFLDAGDGYSGMSAYHGQTVTTPKPVLDKVGLYKVDYQVPDDPAPPGYKYPSDTFASYRKYSDLHTEYVIIHRRPFARFTLAKNGNGTIGYTDTSYDPDRWLSPTNYSTEPTGIDYQNTRGILQRKYNFTTPSGVTMSGQLIRPQESGRYTVRLAVADEYGAWSDWYEQEIDVDAIPNNPPSATLTFPNGTKDHPSYVSLRPTITWNQSDPDPDTTFTGFELTVKDEWGNCFECVTVDITTKNTSWAWTIDQDLAIGAKYQVQVRVRDDSGLWSNWTGIGWMQTNRPPQAYMSYPYGTQESPTVVTTLRPTLVWTQTDPDPSPVFNFFQLQITNEANTVMILDSGKLWQGTSSTTGNWTVNKDLPAGQKLRVRVKVWDEYGAESDWSPQAWMIIDRPPIAAFTWKPTVVYEGDSLQLIDGSSDPDGDPLTYEWRIQTPSGELITSNLKDPVPIKPAQAGNYIVTLKVRDPFGLEAQVTHTIPVLPLTINGAVRHTPQWDVNRQKWNLQQGNDPEAPWRANQFLAGERFVFHADTSIIDPSSADYAESVAVTFERTGHRVWLDPDISRTRWDGELWDNEFTRLTPGPAQFTFQVQYSNGTIKTVVVAVEILDRTIDNFWILKRDL